MVVVFEKKTKRKIMGIFKIARKTAGMQQAPKEFGDFVGGLINPAYAANVGNLKLAEYQYSKDLEMWNMQNEYNSPKSQMQRYIDAGMNPNLVASQGSSGNATQLPKYNAHPLSPVDVMGTMIGMLSGYQDLKIKQAQTTETESNAKILGIRAEFERDVQFQKLYKMYDENEISEGQYIKLRNELDALYGIPANQVSLTGIPRKHRFGDIGGEQTSRQIEYNKKYRDSKLAEFSKTQDSAISEGLRKDLLQMAKDSFIFDKVLQGFKAATGIFSPIKIK